MRKLVVEVTDREYAIIAKLASDCDNTPEQFLHRAGVEGIVQSYENFVKVEPKKPLTKTRIF